MRICPEMGIVYFDRFLRSLRSVEMTEWASLGRNDRVGFARSK
jgi:hypothetical protein